MEKTGILIKLVFVFILSSLLFNCAVTKTHDIVKGNEEFSAQKVQELKLGTSTKDDVEVAIGDPADTRNIDEGLDIWTYSRLDIHVDGGVHSFPLVNLLTAGQMLPEASTKAHYRCQLLFKDDILIDISMGEFDSESKTFINPYIANSKEFWNKYKKGLYDSNERIVLKPTGFKVNKIQTVLDIYPVEHWNLTVEYDLSQIPPDVNVIGAFMRLYAKEKYLHAEKYDNSKIYTPPISRVQSLGHKANPYWFNIPAVDSESVFQVTGSNAMQHMVNIIMLGGMGLRSTFSLKTPGWDTWVVTPFIKNSQLTGQNKVVFSLQPDYSKARGFDYGGMGLRYPIFFKYYTKESLIEDGLPVKYEPYLVIFIEDE